MSIASSGGGGSSSASTNCFDFLHCNKCFYPLSVIPNDSPHRPFFLTNCWHIICGVCRGKGVRSKGNEASCCVCSRPSIRSLELESPISENVKRLFSNYVSEWEFNQHRVEESRRIHASSLRDIAEALEDMTLSSGAGGSAGVESASAKKIAQTAKFQQDQWKSLARGYSGLWSEFRKSRDDVKKYQNELKNVQAALRESEEEKRKLKEKLCALQQQRHDYPKNHQPGRPRTSMFQKQQTTSTPSLFPGDGNSGESFSARSPFFRKNPVQAQMRSSSTTGSGRDNRDPLSELTNADGRRRSTSHFDAVPPAQGFGGDGGRMKTPKIFSTGKENDDGDDLMASPYFRR